MQPMNKAITQDIYCSGERDVADGTHHVALHISKDGTQAEAQCLFEACDFYKSGEIEEEETLPEIINATRYAHNQYMLNRGRRL